MGPQDKGLLGQLSDAANGLAILWGMAAAGVALIPGVGLPVALGAFLGASCFAVVGWGSDIIAADPPRTDFDQVAWFTRVKVTPPEPRGELDNALQGFLVEQLHAGQAINNLALSIERLAGAELAAQSGSPQQQEAARKAATAQREAIAQNAQALRELHASLPGLGRTFSETWQTFRSETSPPAVPSPTERDEIEAKLRAAYQEAETQYQLPKFGIRDSAVFDKALENLNKPQLPDELLDATWFDLTEKIQNVRIED